MRNKINIKVSNIKKKKSFKCWFIVKLDYIGNVSGITKYFI